MANNETNLDSWLKHLPEAYAYHQVITDEAGKPVDCVFLQANPAFETMTGLKVEAIIGRRVTEVMPGIDSGDFDWIGTFGQVALTGESCQVEQYAQPLDRWYSVTAYSDEPGYFAVLFHDITKQQREKETLKTMMNFSQRFLDTENTPDFQEITEHMRTLTGAAYAAFNLFDDNGLDFTTLSLVGASDHLMKAANIIGFNPVGKNWPHDPNREAITQQEKLTTLESLEELTGKVMPRKVVHLLEKTFDIGQVAVVKIKKQDRVMGDFTLIMPRGEQLAHPELAVLYASQVGLFLAKVRYEDKIKESEEQHRRLFETMSPGVIYQNADGSILSANPAAEKMIGITLDQMKGKTSMDPRWKMIKEDGSFVPGSEHPAMISLRTGKITGPLIRGIFIPERDEYVWLSITAIPLLKEEDQPFQVYTVFDDITKQKEKEEKLAFQNVVLNTQQEVSLDGILVTDEHENIISFNKRFADIWEIPDEIMALQSSEKALNFVLPKLIHPKEFVNRIKDLYENKQEQSCEEVLLVDGRILERYSAPMFSHDRHYYGRVWYYRDITQRKQVAEALKIATQQAKSANQAKSRYLAHMNHEIRTPLNGFMGFLQLLELTDPDEEQQEYMNHMKLSTNHLLGIINNVLDYAKIEAGEMQLIKKHFILEEEIKTALAPLRSLAWQNNTRLKITMDKNLPSQLKGDPDRLRQILLNLGSNAVKFTQKGQVHIALTCPETTKDQHFLELVVEDTGSGMTEETLKNLFQPFYQADDGSTPQAKGTGLGLTITRELVEQMGGTIQLDSAPGKGTRVVVNLKLGKVEGTPE